MPEIGMNTLSVNSISNPLILSMERVFYLQKKKIEFCDFFKNKRRRSEKDGVYY